MALIYNLHRESPMLHAFEPHVSGEYRPPSLSSQLLDNLEERVRNGLFPMAKPRRNAYKVVSRTEDSLRFRSTNVLSGINVGLNDVSLTLDVDRGVARFDIRYWTWAKYGIGLCLSIFGLIVLLLTVGRALFPPAWFMNADRMPILKWTMLGFFGFAWPWILVAMHKRPVRRCLVGILDEVNGSGIRRVGPAETQ